MATTTMTIKTMNRPVSATVAMDACHEDVLLSDSVSATPTPSVVGDEVVVAIAVGDTVVGYSVVGDDVGVLVGAAVVGAAVVGEAVVGVAVVGVEVVGANVLGDAAVGAIEGAIEGAAVGDIDGETVGVRVGDVDGLCVGADGARVGEVVGDEVVASMPSNDVSTIRFAQPEKKQKIKKKKM